MSPPPLPRWFLLLPLLAIAAWWPWSPYWQSDDFVALHYANDLGRVLHDFAGPQYGATDVWWFYRPLITLSFWLDLQLAGTSPLLSHVSNVLAHGSSALLVGLVWRRFLPDGSAFVAGLVWALMPGHAGSIVWAVGRVDSHTTVWCLLALWLVLRAQERRHAGDAGPGWPAALATAAALASKELALVVPPLATLLVFARTPPGLLAVRLRAAVAASAWPWLVLAAYVPWRYFVLGRFGGYAGAAYDVTAMAKGLPRVLADLAVPLAWAGRGDAPALLPAWAWLTAAAVPPVLAVLLAIHRAWSLVCGATIAFLIALAPLTAFLAAADNPLTQRLYYLPAAALAGIVAAAGRGCAIVLLLAWAWPLLAVRIDWYRADQETAAMHRALRDAAADGAASPMFVAGLPPTNRSGTAMQLHIGVDRLLQPPFGDGRVEVRALRPPGPNTFLLFGDGAPPFALPEGSTWLFGDATALARALPPPPLPELVVAGDHAGVLDLTTPRLDAIAGDATTTAGLQLPGVRAPFFRVTLFTGGGYLATVCRDHAPAGAPGGAIHLYPWFARGAAYGVDAYIGDALPVPVTVDLKPEFPVLIEAGALQGTVFVPSHRARRLLTFRFDRDYPAWVRRVQGTGQ